ncbi:MAG: TonB-dependent receptor [Sphingomonadales bacterium]|nr:TonB-dependent receptor [Sphingomonadales bacterium]
MDTVKRLLAALFLPTLLYSDALAREYGDTGKPAYLPDVNVVGTARNHNTIHLPEIVGTQIYAGKKNNLILLKNLNAIVVNNSMRQIMAKVAGIHVWESDASGIQIGIAARGLSPNRSWEFNNRQNGYDIASDPFGYPEAYYNPPMQAVQKIQVVRGAGSLQYGPQFGGMVNYVLKDGSDISKSFQVGTQQTIGRFGLINTFNSVGGNTKKLNYYVFYDQRQGNGWRQNNRFQTKTLFGTFTWKARKNINFTAEQTVYSMLSQQPGGLTEDQYHIDPQASYRARNWMNIPWYISALKMNWDINEDTRLQAKAFYINGDRKSVGFLKSATTRDTANSVTGKYANREVSRDLYSNFGTELSLLREYKIGQQKHTFTAGIRYYTGLTTRFQKGIGTSGSDADFSISTPQFPVDLRFKTLNTAGYLENVLRVGGKWLIIPGVRFENILSQTDGRIEFNTNGEEILTRYEKRGRNFVLPGIGIEFHAFRHAEFYANYSKGYRPVLFSDLVQNNTTDVIDPNLKDASGYNADMGLRGNIGKFLRVDIGPYLLQYNSRIASISKTDSSGNIYIFRTNAGSTTTMGVESMVEIDLMEALSVEIWKMPVFLSYSFNHARYNNFIYTSVKNGTIAENNLKGNLVENAPATIIRGGWGLEYKKIQCNIQFSKVSGFYTDAQNTETASANAQTGKLPGYTVWDVNGSFPVYKQITARISVNNLMNVAYATRRAGGYPGPGILPADGRNIMVAVSAVF